LPLVSKKHALKVEHLKEFDIFLVDNVLTQSEAERIVGAAEAQGFQHQGSSGPSHGEVRGKYGLFVGQNDLASSFGIWHLA
jgi:hypothetical protein